VPCDLVAIQAQVSSPMQALLEEKKRGRSINCFANLGAECHFLKLSVASLISPKEGGVSVIYPISN
jgi:hypothetical protein